MCWEALFHASTRPPRSTASIFRAPSSWRRSLYVHNDDNNNNNNNGNNTSSKNTSNNNYYYSSSNSTANNSSNNANPLPGVVLCLFVTFCVKLF